MTFANPPLAGRIAFVSGSSRGIGRAIALELAGWGADVAVHCLKNLDRAEEVVDTIRALGRRAVAVQADVKDREALAAAAERVKSELGGVDILVNNAGTRKDGHFILMSRPTFDEVMETNFFGVVNVTQAFVRGMMSGRWGRIVNIVSPSAVLGMAGQANYGASKGAIIGLTRSLAKELAPFGITVNAVNPGLIETELTADVSEQMRRDMLLQTSLRRMGQAEEVAPVVAFMSSPWSSYMTGQVVNVDGGLCP